MVRFISEYGWEPAADDGRGAFSFDNTFALKASAKLFNQLRHGVNMEIPTSFAFSSFNFTEAMNHAICAPLLSSSGIRYDDEAADGEW